MKAKRSVLLGLLLSFSLAACSGGGVLSMSSGRDNADGGSTGGTYQVIYDYAENGGTSATSTAAAVASGAAVDLTPIATKAGWQFIGWNTDKDATSGLHSYTVTAADVTLYALYAKALEATFQDYTGPALTSRTAAAVMYNKATSAAIAIPAQNTYRDGGTAWTPRGWSRSAAADAAPLSSEPQFIDADTVFYGLYQRTFSLSYDANGGAPTPPSQTAMQFANSHAIEERVTPPLILAAAISRPGVAFDGWALSSPTGTRFGAGDAIQIDRDTVMFAFWKITLGMYYFGNWSPASFNAGPGNCATVLDWWGCIKPYPDRKPFLGWYDNSEVTIVDQQLEWMADYGIDFVAIAWYWRGHPDLLSDTPITTYLQAANRGRVPYALMWANHDGHPNSHADWDAMIDDWLGAQPLGYLVRPEYFQIDGKPAVFIFTAAGLQDQAQNSGFANPAEMFEYAREKARLKGLKGIYFVGSVTAADVRQLDLSNYGLDALSAYNYNGYGTSYAVFDQGYRGQWSAILSNPVLAQLNIPYFVPMSSGADESPWRTTPAVNRMSTPDEFEAHVQAGYETIVGNVDKTKGFGVFCCWNEYGEGTIIEPTEHEGAEDLQRIRAVFRQ